MKQIFYFLMVCFCFFMEAKAQTYPIELGEKYETIAPLLKTEFARFQVANKWGILDKKMTVIVPPIYDGISNYTPNEVSGLWQIVQNEKRGQIDMQGKEILRPEYDLIMNCGDLTSHFVVAKEVDEGYGYKHGLITTKGELIIPCKYDVLFFNNRLLTASLDNNYSELDLKGNEVKKVEKLSAFHYKGQENKIGFHDANDNIIISPKYTHTQGYSNGYRAVDCGGSWGYIDEVGNEVIPCKYSWVLPFNDAGYAVVLNEQGLKGLINKNDRLVLPIKYNEIMYYHKDRIEVKVNGKYGYCNISGKEFCPPKYDFAMYYGDNQIHVWLESKQGVINVITGEIILEPIYEEVGTLVDNRITFKLNGKYGWADGSGKKITPAQFDKLSSLFKGRAIAMQGNKYGTVDSMGNFIIAPQYTKLDWFNENGILIAHSDDKVGLVNAEGIEILPFIYNDISYAWDNNKNPLFFVKQNNHWQLTSFLDNILLQGNAIESNSEFFTLKLYLTGELNIQAKDLLIYINGTVQQNNDKSTSHPLRRVSKAEIEISVRLLSGINNIQVAGGGKLSNIIKVAYQVGKPTLHFCGIGISYKDNNKIDPLIYTQKDVQDVYELFKAQKGKGLLFEDVSPTLTKGTEGDILTQLGEYATAFERGEIRATDVFILYLSGHGLLIDGKFHLACENYSPSSIEHSTVSEEEIFKELSRIKCKKLIFIDACREMIGIDHLANKAPRENLTTAIEKLMTPLEGISFFSACEDGERSQEHSEWENGAFTEKLIEGLTGAADSNHNDLISIKEISDYVKISVPKISPYQHPELRLNQLGDEIEIFVVK